MLIIIIFFYFDFILLLLNANPYAMDDLMKCTVGNMVDIPYTSNTGKLKEFLSTIRTIGVPNSASQDWFQQIGFKSSNDRPILRVMRFINFVDSTSKPTDFWKQYRTDNHKKILAQGVKQGYKELFDIYPDANTRSTKDLNNFFTSKSSAGKQAIDKTIQTFKILCELADFNGMDSQEEIATNYTDASVEQSAPRDQVTLKMRSPSKESGATININIQLTLPETTDSKVYDNFFAAMKNHLFSN